MQMQDQARRLLWHGVFLFLLGLITGLAIPIISNHRMALSAHLEALLNGILRQQHGSLAIIIVSGVELVKANRA